MERQESRLRVSSRELPTDWSTATTKPRYPHQAVIHDSSEREVDQGTWGTAQKGGRGNPGLCMCASPSGLLRAYCELSLYEGYQAQGALAATLDPEVSFVQKLKGALKPVCCAQLCESARSTLFLHEGLEVLFIVRPFVHPLVAT